MKWLLFTLLSTCVGVFGDREDNVRSITDEVKALLCPAVQDQHFFKLQAGLTHTVRLGAVQDLSAAVSEACLPLMRSRQILWIAGPPGSGKTTLGNRFQQYGFMAFDCEDISAKPSKTPVKERLINETLYAREHGRTAFAIPACYSQWLNAAPDFVIPVVLLPSRDVYTRRWKSRNPYDTQQHSKRYGRTLRTAQRLEREKPGRAVVLRQDDDTECPDLSIYRICSAVNSLREARNP